MQSEIESVLICGGSGYIGGSFAYLISKVRPDVKIIVLDNLSNGHHVNQELFVFYECDIGNSELVAKIIRDHNIKTVFNFSAFLDVHESVSKPLKYYKNNISNSISLLQTCIDEGVKYFVFSSSAAVYGQPKYIPIDEQHPTSPINPYGRSKLMFEGILEDVAQAHKDFHFVSLRYFNVAGTISKKILHGESTMPETHLIPRVLDVALGIRPNVQIFGTDWDTPDGTCIRDYIDLKDLCEAHLLAWDYLVKNKKSKIINLGTENGSSVREIIDLAKKVTQRDIPVKEGPRREGDPSQLIASNKKALELLNWKPKQTLEKTIERAWAWQLSKYSVISHHSGFNLYHLVGLFKRVMENPKIIQESEEKIIDGHLSASKDPNRPNEHNFRLFFAPGRINLIGEHVDYNGGLVMPCAINKGTYILCRLNNSKKIHFCSDFYNDVVCYDLNEDLVSYPKKNNWSDYVLGCLLQCAKHFKLDIGFDALIWGNMPMSAGISSSASLSVAVLTAVIEMVKPDFHASDPHKGTRIALMAKAVENEFVGVSCGIMDQFIVANAQYKHAMLLNCDSLEFQNIPVNLSGYCFLLCNTNLKRELRTSKYNERFEECQKALEKLQRYKDHKHLAHFDQESIQELAPYLEMNEILIARTKHVISENRRVKKAFECLKENKLEEFGELLTESGQSLQNEYEVTGPHLDWIVQAALISEGVLGARMMGAGFGGCALVLASKNHLKSIKEMITKVYSENSGIEPTFYEFELDQGAREIKF